MVSYLSLQVQSQGGQFRNHARDKYVQHLSSFTDVRREFGNGWTEAVVSVNKLSPRANYHLILQSSGRNERATVANWKRISIGRHGPRISYGKKELNRQILKVVYVQYVGKNHLQAALCLAGDGASSVTRQMHGRLSMSGIAAHLENGSVKPSGSSEGGRSDVQEGHMLS